CPKLSCYANAGHNFVTGRSIYSYEFVLSCSRWALSIPSLVVYKAVLVFFNDSPRKSSPSESDCNRRQRGFDASDTRSRAASAVAYSRKLERSSGMGTVQDQFQRGRLAPPRDSWRGSPAMA